MEIFLLGLLALAAIAASDKKPARPVEGGNGLFHLLNGGPLRAYNPIPRQQIIDSFAFRVLYPTEEPTLFSLVTGDGRIFGPQEAGAWFMVKALHDAGYSVWVTPTLHEAFAEAPVLVLPPGAEVPVGFVLLISPDLPYPHAPPGLEPLLAAMPMMPPAAA